LALRTFILGRNSNASGAQDRGAPHASGFGRTRNLVSAADVAGPDGGAQTVGCIVALQNCVVFILEENDGGYGAKERFDAIQLLPGHQRTHESPQGRGSPGLMPMVSLGS